MPCNSDYMEPNVKEFRLHDKELRLQRTAKLYAFVLQENGKFLPSDVRAACITEYCASDYVADLCTELREMKPTKRHKLLTDVDSGNPKRNAMIRNLGAWWDQHQKADRRRRNNPGTGYDSKVY